MHQLNVIHTYTVWQNQFLRGNFLVQVALMTNLLWPFMEPIRGVAKEQMENLLVASQNKKKNTSCYDTE